MKKDLGKINRIKDLRTVWPNEASDFTKWLAKADNLKALGSVLNMDLELCECESAVGGYRVDILATEIATGHKVIIENQLEKTDHDHLGKLITYASGKDANVVVWVVKQAREEHMRAIEWLNERTDDKIAFFLLEIELWQIDDSRLAPNFNIVEQPNNWARQEKQKDAMTETDRNRLEFWQRFVDYAFDKDGVFASNFNKRKPSIKQVYDLAFGKKYQFCLRINLQQKKFDIFVYMSHQPELYENFKKHSAEIEKEIGHKLVWRDKAPNARYIYWTSPNNWVDISEKNINSIFDWFINAALKYKEVFAKYDE